MEEITLPWEITQTVSSLAFDSPSGGLELGRDQTDDSDDDDDN